MDEDFTFLTEDFRLGILAYLESLADGNIAGAKNCEIFMVNAAFLAAYCK